VLERFKSRRRLVVGADRNSSDQIYARGGWDCLRDTSELARYSVIAGYCDHLGARSVLDVGCGEGLLAERITMQSRDSYVGVDVSTIAIDTANSKGIQGADFVVSEAQSYVPTRRFDAIVFNEVLYYLEKPAGVLTAYADHLEPTGAFIVSIHRSARHRWVWRDLGRRLQTVDAVAIENAKGVTWDVRLLRP
jgi:2-polyprenyl-6-hydroxyphenyl methylase/3-demethylubiquinone-9 3-methyltransferase